MLTPYPKHGPPLQMPHSHPTTLWNRKFAPPLLSTDNHAQNLSFPHGGTEIRTITTDACFTFHHPYSEV